jgi:hypothetical protein
MVAGVGRWGRSSLGSSKFFVSHGEESIQDMWYTWYMWSLLKVREGNYKSEYSGHRWNLQASLLQMLLKPRLIYGKGGIRWFPSNNQ